MLAIGGPALGRSGDAGHLAFESSGEAYRLPMKIALIVLCLFFPFIAVLLKKGPCMAVVWALLLQLLGHIPGVIYGIVKVTED
jgi:uncharacterized membrane protein YqaE (UPF0057 family)